MLQKIINICGSPLKTCRRIANRLTNNSGPTPGHLGLWQQYTKLAKSQGLKRLYLLLSFDCDTPEDIAAASELDPWLAAKGLKRTYAVPGAQLEQGGETYQALARAGADFINHGQRPHAERRGDRYWPMTFYNEMTSQEVVEDIRLGHQTCLKVLGQAAKGFRAPHFGYFQKPEQRELMYAELRRLGYAYSSSTVPQLGFEQGPVIQVKDLFEIPLSGSLDLPYTILDSWNYVKSPQEPTITSQYAELFKATVDGLLEVGVCGVLNYYVDPAHVRGAPGFKQAMEHALGRGLVSLDYSGLLALREN